MNTYLFAAIILLLFAVSAFTEGPANRVDPATPDMAITEDIAPVMTDSLVPLTALPTVVGEWSGNHAVYLR
ncbi:hypothetical protein [Neolewinella sp.]|uniref:hypothetical protein n=1 Tax=Neolewinella sp. TaxID=2993543 RepID=UPI003B51A146